jgi:hypothetical protein
MTTLTKARIVALTLAAKEGSLVVGETDEGICIGIVDQQGFIPLAAVWPDDVSAKGERKSTIGFLPPMPSDGIVN